MEPTKNYPNCIEYKSITVGHTIVHASIFDDDITHEQAEDYLKDQGWFGYHPSGYGGLSEVQGNKVIYQHWDSCD